MPQPRKKSKLENEPNITRGQKVQNESRRLSKKDKLDFVLNPFWFYLLS